MDGAYPNANGRTSQASAPERDDGLDGSGRWMQVRAAKASAEIVAQIRERLFDGKFRPGDFVGTERSLAVEFGVSRLTMRDALRILEANGIVEVKVGKSGGVRIAKPSPERFADALAVQLTLAGISHGEIFEAQMAVETQAVRAAAKCASDADLALLTAQLERLQAAKSDDRAFVRESLEFHTAIVRASGNRALIAQFQALRHLTWRVILPLHSSTRAAQVVARQAKVLAALRRRQGEEAAALVVEHLQAVISAHSQATAQEASGQPAAISAVAG